MKRYGFKFESWEPGSSSFIELRFTISLLCFAGLMGSPIFAGVYNEAYIFLWFLYLVLAFVPEVWKKLGLFPLVVGCIGITILGAVVDWRNEAARGVFLVYNLAVLLACYRCRPARRVEGD